MTIAALPTNVIDNRIIGMCLKGVINDIGGARSQMGN
jgi:hypothetical protein